MSSGDLIAQTCFERTPMSKIDWLRTARFGLIGATFVGPTIRIWFLKLEKLVGSGVTVQKTLSKVALDQLCFAPAFQVPILAYIGLLQGQNLSQIHVKIKRELKDIILTGWKVSSVQHVSIHLEPKIVIRMYISLLQIWPATQLVNFYFVPFLVRPLVVGLVALGWNSYLAWKANSNPG